MILRLSPGGILDIGIVPEEGEIDEV